MALTEVNSLGIKDLEVKTADIAAANVTLAKVENVTDGQIIVGNGSNRPTAVAVSGDVTLANTGAVTIATGAVEHAMLANDAVDGDNIADNSVTLAHMAGGTDGQIITYDAEKDAFIPPRPYDAYGTLCASWTLNSDSCQWVAPSNPPDRTKIYKWKESNTSWEEVT